MRFPRILTRISSLLSGAKNTSDQGTLYGVRHRLAEQAANIGWRKAVLDTLGSHPELFQYVGDERAADWRFLLPQLPRGQALCIGGALSPIPVTLARTCQRVVIRATHPEDIAFLKTRAQEEGCGNIEAVLLSNRDTQSFDLVAALRSAPDGIGSKWTDLGLPAIISHVRQGGHLYLEIDHPAFRLPPAVMRRRLRRAGFTHVRCYWPKPTFSSCEMLLPLGDRRLQKYYLNHVFFAMSFQRRLLRRLLAVAVRLGLFELTLPGYMVVAQRSSGSRSAHVGAY